MVWMGTLYNIKGILKKGKIRTNFLFINCVRWLEDFKGMTLFSNDRKHTFTPCQKLLAKPANISSSLAPQTSLWSELDREAERG